ncbi:MbnP family protein [Fibrella aquatica]|uniref:MbnP family protein n=1 Tax=Fibrella aquatica TaxID=3242487 RepID=UPI003520EF80
MRLLFGLFFASLALISCKSDDVGSSVAKVEVTFNNLVNGADLLLGTQTYQNKSGESFTITRFDYFVSNLRFIRADGSAYTVPQDSSYFLIRESDPASQKIAINNVPEGDYTQLEFMVGVDSLRNTADVGKRTGVLDPAGSHTSGMYWDWNTGYIHLKLEGTSPQAPLNATGTQNFRYHIGLFGGYQTRTLNNTRLVQVGLPAINVNRSLLRIGGGEVIGMSVDADAGKLFDGPTSIRIAQYPEVMVSPVSATIATNYASMFSIGKSVSVLK